MRLHLFALSIMWLFTTQCMAHTVQVELFTQKQEVTGPFWVDVVKSHDDMPLTEQDVSVYNGKVIALKDEGKTSRIWVQPHQSGEVVVRVATPVPPKRRLPKHWNKMAKFKASELLKVQYTSLNIPTVHLYAAKQVSQQTFDIAISFSEPVTGLKKADFVLTNAHAIALSGSGRYYYLSLRADSSGMVSVMLPQGAVFDTDGDNLVNRASNLITLEANLSDEPMWQVSTEQAWKAVLAGDSQVSVAQGVLHPTQEKSVIRSQFYRVAVKQKASSMVLTQSPVWDNWQPAGNVGPEEARDALVFVPVSENNYYLLGSHKDRRRQYDAWHSTDMKTWVNKGPVTPVGAKWVTTAEYKDGLFYIYYDHPNDEDPALIIDDDLSDGIPGHNLGTVFDDPSHGSDISIFRDDADNRFHLIYEDWSPIKANSHAYDSPLAGHTSSRNGIQGFEAHTHQPPVDFRGEATDNYDIYFHGTTKAERIYRVHQGKQSAFGDWTSIKVGNQYYLFGDYDSYNEEGRRQPMQTARFTSDSMFKPFQLVGAFGDGHPDPTVGFAHGQFYLITQRAQDFVSSGPWVDGVSARVGVDIDGDNTVDKWTEWQHVYERYQQKSGYLRVIEKQPAQVDVSALPAGEQFTFEIKIDDSIAPNATPLIRSVVMTFEGA